MQSVVFRPGSVRIFLIGSPPHPGPWTGCCVWGGCWQTADFLRSAHFKHLIGVETGKASATSPFDWNGRCPSPFCEDLQDGSVSPAEMMISILCTFLCLASGAATAPDVWLQTSVAVWSLVTRENISGEENMPEIQSQHNCQRGSCEPPEWFQVLVPDWCYSTGLELVQYADQMGTSCFSTTLEPHYYILHYIAAGLSQKMQCGASKCVFFLACMLIFQFFGPYSLQPPFHHDFSSVAFPFGLISPTPASDVAASYLWPGKELVLLWNHFFGARSSSERMVPHQASTGTEVETRPEVGCWRM